MKETKTYCDGCGKEIEGKQIGFFGDIFLPRKPEVQYCHGCASVICREVFDDVLEAINNGLLEEFSDALGSQPLARDFLNRIRGAVAEYCRLRNGLVSGVRTGNDLLNERIEARKK